jgi:hypothetical protein
MDGLRQEGALAGQKKGTAQGETGGARASVQADRKSLDIDSRAGLCEV